jgi:hypothetical protein
VTLTCLVTNNHFLLPGVSPSHNLPCVSLLPDMPGANLSITLTIRDIQSLTMFRASLSRHKPINSWPHTDNLSTVRHLSICHTNSWLHTDYLSTFLHLSTCHTNSWLHTDNPPTFLQLSYNRW